MSSAHPAPSLPAGPTGPAEEDHAFYRAALHALIAVGADLAADIQAARKDGQITPAEAADAFERVSRATRRTVLLAAKLGESPASAPAASSTRTAARREVIRAVEDAITREPELDAEARHAAESEFRERLDAPEFAEELDSRPVAEVVQTILRDMDLGRMPFAGRAFRRRTPETLRHLHALARGEPTPLPARSELGGPQDLPTLLDLHAHILGTRRPPEPAVPPRPG